MTKTIYQTDDLGRFVAAMTADLDPLETAATGDPVYLIPGGAVETPPPTVLAGSVAVWIGGSWSIMTEAEAANGGPVPVEVWRTTATLSQSQLVRAMISASLLTSDEALVWAAGTIPALINGYIDGMAAGDQGDMRLAVAWREDIPRNSALWDAVVDAGTLTQSAIDSLYGWTS